MIPFKELAAKTITFLIPVLKSKAAKKVGSDFSEAINNEIILLWEKIKPVFIEEIKDETIIFEKTPENKDVQNDIEHELKKILKKDENIAISANNLLNKIEKEQPGYISKHNEMRIEGKSNIGIMDISNSTININK